MKNELPFDFVCFGEVLWDILPTGKTAGGAPMNVTYHLTRQQCNSTLITSIGADEAGSTLKDVFGGKGVDTSFFQVDTDHETGKVYGTANEQRDMTYDIVQNVAWDFIRFEKTHEQLLSETSCFVFGSLAARSKVSRNTLFSLLEMAPKKVYDVNLRAPHFSKELVSDLLARADLVKMNLEELQLVSEWFSPHKSVMDNVRFIADKYKVDEMVITKGGSGAIFYTDGSFYNHAGYRVQVADTVGSGDAFLAGLLASLHANVEPAVALERASRLGAFIATKHGACPDYDTSWMTADDWFTPNEAQ